MDTSYDNIRMIEGYSRHQKEHEESNSRIVFLCFIHYLFWGDGGARRRRVGDWASGEVGGEMRAIILICDTLYKLNIYCYEFSSRYSIQ